MTSNQFNAVSLLPRWSHKILEEPKFTNSDRGKVLLIVTGGTICMHKIPGSDTLQSMDFVNLRTLLPELNNDEYPLYDVLERSPLVDSSDIGFSIYKEIAKQIQNNYSQYNGFVILHGTDTMAYTGSMLSFILQNLGKPVIATGSMIPINVLATDAKRNLSVSMKAAIHKNLTEVAIVFGSRILRANRASKIDCTQVEAFDSPNSPLLGRFGIDIVFNESHFLAPPTIPFDIFLDLFESIPVVNLTPTLSLPLLQNILNSLPTAGAILLKIYGSGTVPGDPALLKILQTAIFNGLSIVVLSQCIRGHVNLNAYANGAALIKMGVINGKDMTSEACIAKLSYFMGKGYRGNELKLQIEKSFRGELSNET